MSGKNPSLRQWLIATLLLAAVVMLDACDYCADETETNTSDDLPWVGKHVGESCQRSLDCAFQEECDPVALVCRCVFNYVYDPQLEVCTFDLFSWSVIGQIALILTLCALVTLAIGVSVRYAIFLWRRRLHQMASNQLASVLVDNEEELGCAPPGMSLYEAKQLQFEYYRRLREREQRASEQADNVGNAIN